MRNIIAISALIVAFLVAPVSAEARNLEICEKNIAAHIFVSIDDFGSALSTFGKSNSERLREFDAQVQPVFDRWLMRFAQYLEMEGCQTPDVLSIGQYGIQDAAQAIVHYLESEFFPSLPYGTQGYVVDSGAYKRLQSAASGCSRWIIGCRNPN
jgi:hypothetical protein